MMVLEVEAPGGAGVIPNIMVNGFCQRRESAVQP